jgi:hypothetical protein
LHRWRLNGSLPWVLYLADAAGSCYFRFPHPMSCTNFSTKQCPHFRTCYVRIPKVRQPHHLLAILAHLPPWTPQVHQVHTWAPELSHSTPSAPQVTPHVIPHSSCTILLCLLAQQSRIWLQYSHACPYYLPQWWACCEHAHGLVAVRQIVSIGFHYSWSYITPDQVYDLTSTLSTRCHCRRHSDNTLI